MSPIFLHIWTCVHASHIDCILLGRQIGSCGYIAGVVSCTITSCFHTQVLQPSNCMHMRTGLCTCKLLSPNRLSPMLFATMHEGPRPAMTLLRRMLDVLCMGANTQGKRGGLKEVCFHREIAAIVSQLNCKAMYTGEAKKPCLMDP
jgi:hypothetical protein